MGGIRWCRPLAVVALVCAAAPVCALAATGLRHLIDLGVYLFGGDAVLAGVSPYAAREPVANLPFTYPPIAAVLFAPLSALPAPLANVIWLSLVVVCAGIALAVLFRERDGQWPTTAALVGLTAAAFLTEPFYATFGYGQINTILLALVVVDAALVRRGSSYAGLLTGLAAAVKLTPAIFILYWLLTGRRQAAARASVVFAALCVLPLVVAPAWAPGYWTDRLTDPERLGWTRGGNNQSLLGMVGRWWVDGADASSVRLALFVPVLVPGLWLAYRARAVGRDDLGIAVTAVVALLATPASWDHHYVWAVPLIVLMAARSSPTSWRIVAAVAVAVLVVAPPRRVPFDPRTLTSPGLLDGLLLAAYTLLALGLLVLVWVELWRRSMPSPVTGADRDLAPDATRAR